MIDLTKRISEHSNHAICKGWTIMDIQINSFKFKKGVGLEMSISQFQENSTIDSRGTISRAAFSVCNHRSCRPWPNLVWNDQDNSVLSVRLKKRPSAETANSHLFCCWDICQIHWFETNVPQFPVLVLDAHGRVSSVFRTRQDYPEIRICVQRNGLAEFQSPVSYAAIMIYILGDNASDRSYHRT